MKHISDAPLSVRLLALSTNIRLGWKGLPGTNVLAYYEKSLLTAVKKFYNIGHWFIVIKLFSPQQKFIDDDFKIPFLLE
jgi:hypothetical protein